MDKTNIEKLMIAQIASGIIANPHVFETYKDELADGANIEDCIVRDAKIYVEKIIQDENQISKKSKRSQTGLFDANGNQILDGDIIVYTKFWNEDLYNKKEEVLKELINEWKKYEELVSLHPVFWDDDLHAFCSDVYSDSDQIWKLDQNHIYIVSNNEEHPELYNY